MSYLYDNFVDSEDMTDEPDSYIFADEPDDEMAERRGRRVRRPSPVRPATGAGLGGPAGASPPRNQPVTQAQLQAALTRVRQQVTANATAIKTIDGRVRTVIDDSQKLKVATDSQISRLRSELKTTQTISALLPLLVPPGSQYANVAPLIHIIGPELMSGKSGSAASGGFLGNSSNLIAIGALAFASGVLDPRT
jgi:hypothetical protein